MAKIEDKELYPIFYAIHLHESGQKVIPSLTLPDELKAALGRFRKKHGNTITPPASLLTQDRIRSVIKLIEKSPENQIKLYEDGPEAPRPKTLDEIAAEEREAAEEEARLVKKFYYSAAYALVAFIVGWFCFYQKAMIDKANMAVETQNVAKSLDAAARMPHPLEMAGFGFFFVCAWGIATCWGIARHSFLDFGRVQEAVPVVGKAWAARSKRKRKERDQAMREETQRQRD